MCIRDSDRIDEALQYFAQYHYDGVERMYMKYQVTADDITRARADESVGSGTEGLVSNTFSNQKNFIVMPSAVLSVMNIFNFNDKSNLNMFDIRYQISFIESMIDEIANAAPRL